MTNEILKIHSDWLIDNGYYKKAVECNRQSRNIVDERCRNIGKIRVRNKKGRFTK